MTTVAVAAARPAALQRPSSSAGTCRIARSAAAGPRQRRLPAHRAPPPPLRAAAAAASAESDSDDGPSGFCLPAEVTVDNERSACFTVLDVEVEDYPGLLRVISWTLNGLDVVAQNARVRTCDDGIARNTFWLTNRRGGKLKDAAAEALAERVRDFVTYCSPDESTARRQEFCAGPIGVSNSQHERYTVVTVLEPRPTPGFLLEVASALSGMNVQISQGLVQGVECEGDDLVQDDQIEGSCLVAADAERNGGRVFKFWVQDAQGGKLDYGGMTALVYTLSSVLGYRSHPTVPPDQELLLSVRNGGS